MAPFIGYMERGDSSCDLVSGSENELMSFVSENPVLTSTGVAALWATLRSAAAVSRQSSSPKPSALEMWWVLTSSVTESNAKAHTATCLRRYGEIERRTHARTSDAAATLARKYRVHKSSAEVSEIENKRIGET